MMAADFTDLIDLAAERVGGVALMASDDFFAEKENLLKGHAAVWKEHEYTDKGKWMDGWESRRRRDPDWSGTGPGTPFDRGSADHDWCVIRLGLPGVVKGVVIDTAFFRGNFPESASIECAELPNANADYAAYRDAKWEELLPRTKLEGNAKNTFAIPKPRRATHLRLNIFPDGGVARLRVHGTVAPDWDAITAAGGPVDLAAAENGGSVPVCSDMFFGSRHNLVLPGRAPNMSEGWETKRRRGPGNDWTIVELGARGVLRRVEVDTTHFRGNAPNEILLEGLDHAGATVEQLTSSKAWRTLLRKTKAQPHTRHLFADELRAIGPVSHVRLSVFPCGGVSRLRAWGDVAARSDAAGVAKLNALGRTEAVTALQAACGSKAWAEKMADRRPFEDLPALQRIAEQVWWSLGESDWLEAFSAHPRIGEKKQGADTHSKWAGQEQAGAASASDATKAALAAKNAEYEKKFGFVYLVCATGKSADEMLSILNERLDSTRDRELRTAAEEQANITRLRLRKWVMGS